MSLFENIMKDFSEETNLEVKIESDNSCAFEFEDLLIVLQYRQAADDLVSQVSYSFLLEQFFAVSISKHTIFLLILR